MGTFLIVVAIVLLIAAVIVFVLALRRAKEPKQPAGRQDPLHFANAHTFGPRQLGPGAIISHGGVDYVVRGSATMHQGPFVWWEHLLEGGSEPVWLGVEEDDGRLELVWWVRRSDLQMEPGGSLTVDGVTFGETERGRASYTTEGTTGLPAGGDMDFVDYASTDRSAFLGFERWAPGTSWEVSHGKPVAPGELTVYPAPPPDAT